MPLRGLSKPLVEHLVDEFGADGARAAEFLGSAHALLAGDSSLPQAASHAAYAIREGLMALLRSAQVPDVPPWREASRAVVAAKETFLAARGLPGAGEEAALEHLVGQIDEMALTHDRAGLHQQRLIAVMLERTGAAPLEVGLKPVSRFDQVLDGANERLHGAAALDETCALWDEAVGLLEQLFLPPKARHDELERLAKRTDAGPADIERALQLLATPEHLQYFLARITAPAWLVDLAKRGMLEPTAASVPWPGFPAVEALRETYPNEVLAVLEDLATRHQKDELACWPVARAAHDLGPVGRDLVLRLAAKHPASPSLVVLAIDAATDGDPADDFVEAVADVVLNSSLLATRGHFVEGLLKAYIQGIRPENAAARIQLLCHKLRRVPADDLDLRTLSSSNASVALSAEYRSDEPVPILLGALTASLMSAATMLPVDDLVASVEKLPAALRSRLKTWILATAPAVSREVVLHHVLEAVREREATADDSQLVERLVQMGEVADCIPGWRDALGEPPELSEVARALNERAPDRDWLRVRTWSAVLPEEAWAAWAPVLAVLRSAYGAPEDRFLPPPKVAVGWGRSPMTTEELQALAVREAAEKVAAWRPAPNEMLVSARELGRVLESAVAADPVAWAERALETAAVLHHPTYVAYYIRGLTLSKRLSEINVAGVLEVIEVMAAHPWPTTPLGRDNQFDYDDDWSAVDDEAVALIRALAEADISLESKKDWAWNLVLNASRCELPEGEEEDTTADPHAGALGRAINRSCTKALEAVVYLAGQAYRGSGGVPAAALEEFERVLELPRENGLQHRAILAPRISFLRQVAPDWTDDHLDLIYGAAAPEGLADETLGLTLQRSRPARWFLEAFAPRVINRAAADDEKALEHALVAMLWGVPGYDAAALCRRLHVAGLLSSSGEKLGRLLDGPGADGEHVQKGRAYWEAALGTGSDDLAGFGWFAEVECLDEPTWLELTLQTVQQASEQLDWAHAVSERAVRAMPSERALALLNALVRRLTDPWERRSIGEQAAVALQAAGDLTESPDGKRLDTTLRERGFLG